MTSAITTATVEAAIPPTCPERQPYWRHSGLPVPSSEQHRVMTSFAHGDNIVVRAVAGAGKTTTSLMMAWHNACISPTKSTLLIVYNRGLADDTKKRVASLSFPEGSLTVLTIHSAAGKAYSTNRNGPNRRVIRTDVELYKYLTASPFGDSFPEDSLLFRDTTDGFSTVIVDEAQDLTADRVQLIRMILHHRPMDQHHPRRRQLVLVGDDTQAIYEYSGTSTLFMREPETTFFNDDVGSRPFARHFQNASYRFGTHIANFIQTDILNGYAYDDACRRALRGMNAAVEDRKPEMYICSKVTQETVQFFADMIYGDIVKYGITNVFILTYSTNNLSNLIRRIVNQLAAQHHIATNVHASKKAPEVAGADVSVFEIDKLLVTSLHSSKGREKKAAYVFGADEVNLQRFFKDWYFAKSVPYIFHVGLTRAKERLVLVSSAEAPFLRSFKTDTLADRVDVYVVSDGGRCSDAPMSREEVVCYDSKNNIRGQLLSDDIVVSLLSSSSSKCPCVKSVTHLVKDVPLSEKELILGACGVACSRRQTCRIEETRKYNIPTHHSGPPVSGVPTTIQFGNRGGLTNVSAYYGIAIHNYAQVIVIGHCNSFVNVLLAACLKTLHPIRLHNTKNNTTTENVYANLSKLCPLEGYTSIIICVLDFLNYTSDNGWFDHLTFGPANYNAPGFAAELVSCIKNFVQNSSSDFIRTNIEHLVNLMQWYVTGSREKKSKDKSCSFAENKALQCKLNIFSFVHSVVSSGLHSFTTISTQKGKDIEFLQLSPADLFQLALCADTLTNEYLQPAFEYFDQRDIRTDHIEAQAKKIVAELYRHRSECTSSGDSNNAVASASSFYSSFEVPCRVDMQHPVTSGMEIPIQQVTSPHAHGPLEEKALHCNPSRSVLSNPTLCDNLAAAVVHEASKKQHCIDASHKVCPDAIQPLGKVVGAKTIKECRDQLRDKCINIDMDFVHLFKNSHLSLVGRMDYVSCYSSSATRATTGLDESDSSVPQQQLLPRYVIYEFKNTLEDDNEDHALQIQAYMAMLTLALIQSSSSSMGASLHPSTSFDVTSHTVTGRVLNTIKCSVREYTFQSSTNDHAVSREQEADALVSACHRILRAVASSQHNWYQDCPLLSGIHSVNWSAQCGRWHAETSDN